MENLTLMFAIISCITTILSIIFAILAFARNKSKDSIKLEMRLTSIEKDVIYIRQSLDESREWRKEIDKRLYLLENRK